MSRRHAAALALLIGLSSCNSTFDLAVAPSDERLYERLYPYYAELCAVSQIRKNPGYGVDTSGGWGGHSVFYLNGVCRDRGAGYPTIALCGDDASAAEQGVGLSVNAHFKNANWIATDGRDFFFHGDLAPQERLTRAAYDRTQKEAESKGLLDGIVFHDEVFEDMPPEMGRRDFMYEVSIATDYAVNFARDRYCARVPLTRAQMGEVVAYLNGVNEIYKNGRKEFEWNVVQNNCTHLAHNALAAAGIWNAWETDRFIVVAAFDFPVPKNEFVDLMRRTNDTDVSDPHALFEDKVARRALIDYGRLPVEPGALAEAEPVVQQNDIYDTQPHLIFYDTPVVGSYERHFRAIFSEPRYTDIRANLRFMVERYRRIAANSAAAAAAGAKPGGGAADDFGAFVRLYDAHIARETAAMEATLTALSQPPVAVIHGPVTR